MTTPRGEFAQKIYDLDENIRRRSKELADERNRVENLLQIVGKPIKEVSGVCVYCDRVVSSDGVTIPLNKIRVLEVRENGSIQYTTRVTGGGKRPTLTRVATGAIVAGPVGAVVGMAAQKQKKVKTEEVIHDTRSASVTVGDGNNLRFTVNINGAAGMPLVKAQELQSAIETAMSRYDVHKDDAKKKATELKKRLAELDADTTVARLKKKRSDMLANATPKQKEELGREQRRQLRNNLIKTALVVAGIILVIAAAQGSKERTVVVDGSEVKVKCSSSLTCSEIEGWGDKGVIEKLAMAGITDIESGSKSDDRVELTTGDDIDITVSYNGDTVNEISNSLYPSIIYYSSNDDFETVKYPAQDKIDEAAALKEALEEEKREEEERTRLAEEEEARREAEAEAAYPSDEQTRYGCEEYAKRIYPYGVNVHSVLGVIALNKVGTNEKFYKVEVDVTNMYNATYSGVMECTVQKNGSNYSISSFVVY